MRIAICDDQDAQCQLLTQQLLQLAKNRSLPVQIQTFVSADAFLFAYETDKTGIFCYWTFKCRAFPAWIWLGVFAEKKMI